MPIRLGPGPVFVYEGLAASRRWQTYAVRVLFLSAILAGLAFTWETVTRGRSVGGYVTIAEAAHYGWAIHNAIAVVGLALVLLSAPAATAGAVCLDKARGTLDHMLVTDLSNAEIVLGKLGIRLMPVLGLIAATVPVLAMCSMLGGIAPEAILGMFLLLVGCAVVGCSLAMLLSVYGRKTHEVLMMTYMILIGWLLSPFIAAVVLEWLGSRPAFIVAPRLIEGIAKSNPCYLVFAMEFGPTIRVDVTTYLGFLGGCLATSLGLLGISTSRIRAVAMRQAGRPSVRARRRWLPRLPRPWWWPDLPGPSIDDNPVAWREWHRMQPSRMMRVAWAMYAAFGWLWFAMGVTTLGRSGRGYSETMGGTVGFQVAVGLLLLCVGASTSLSEERTRGSLDVLMTTPMSSRSILEGKRRGAQRRFWSVAHWPALIGLLILSHDRGSLFNYALLVGLVLSYGSAIVSLGLATATWVGRPGRAVALCVGLYVGGSIVWAFLIGSSFQMRSLGLDLMLGTPAFGAFAAAAMIWPPTDVAWTSEFRCFAVLWIFAYLGVSRGLFGATVASFDRRLGRMSEGGGSPS